MFHWLKKKKDELRLILTEKEACERHLIPGITAIIPTYSSSPDIFAFALLSLLANSSRDHLNHIIVTINGPDERTGSPILQDMKQEFLEAIRREHWDGGAMPLTVQRVWSRVGHGQSIDSAMPWVHTRDFLLMHDDAIVLDPDWGALARGYLDNKKIGLAYVEDPIRNLGFLLFEKRRGLWTVQDETPPQETSLNFPHPHTFFLVGRKSDLLKHKWENYFCRGPWNWEWDEDLKSLTKPPKRFLNLDHANYLSYEIGSWLMHNLKNEGYKIAQLPEKTAYHLGAFSLSSEAFRDLQRKKAADKIAAIEKRIKEKIPQLYLVYERMFKTGQVI
jgi:hypothetical protein